MSEHDYLTLRSTRLEPHGEWQTKGGGLVLVFPNHGAGHGISGRASKALRAGDVLVLDRTLGLRVLAQGGEAFGFSYLGVYLEHLIPLLGSDEMGLLQKLAEALRQPWHGEASSPVARECHRLLAEAPAGSLFEQRTHLLRVVTVALSQQFNTLRTRHSELSVPGIRGGVTFDELTPDDIQGLKVGAMAAKLGVSRRHLNRLFRLRFGTSVAALKMEIRLLKAAFLLLDPRSKVLQVAEDCDFHHQGLFNSRFKKRFGVTPGEWRRKMRAVATEAPTPHAGGGGCLLQVNGLCPWTALCPTDDALQQQGDRAPHRLTSNDMSAALLQPVQAWSGLCGAAPVPQAVPVTT